LETVLGLILQNVPNSESTVHDLLAKSRNEHFFSKDLATIWRKSRLAKDLSKLLDHDPQESSTVTIPDELEWDTLELINTPDIPVDTAHTTSSLNEPVLQAASNSESGPKDGVDQKFPPDTFSMLENYFTYTHCWFPIMERHDLLRTMHTSTENQSTLCDGPRLALWALVAYETSTRDSADPERQDNTQLQNLICARVVTQSSNIELGHIQAVLVLSLLQMKLGDIFFAWRLAGQGSRMLASLPTAAKSNRYQHTLRGCIFLDNMLSTLLDKAPCMSLVEQQQEEMVNEDNMEEWDVWTISPQSSDTQRMGVPQGPLRALSIFNKVSHLMTQLARILYKSSNTPCADSYELSSTLQAEQVLIAQKYPYSLNPGCATPPIIILHLTCNFVILALYSTNQTLETIGKDLADRLLQSTISLLDLYVKLTGVSRVSPLFSCFAMQGKRCLTIISSRYQCEEWEAMARRFNFYLSRLKTTTGKLGGSSTNPYQMPRASNNGFVQPSVLQVFDSQLETPISAPSVNPSLEPRDQSPTEVAAIDTAGFDALFEEMVTSIPSNRYAVSIFLIALRLLIRPRQQPLFAQNLGFFAEDFDKDFLDQLQQPPVG
jgi:hypothetical protein